MKKLFYSISTVLILLAFGFIVLAITSNRSFMGTRSVHFKSGEIQEIIIVNGMNLKDVTLTDPDQIESFRNKLNQTKFQKGRKNDSDGWSYVI